MVVSTRRFIVLFVKQFDKPKDNAHYKKELESNSNTDKNIDGTAILTNKLRMYVLLFYKFFISAYLHFMSEVISPTNLKYNLIHSNTFIILISALHFN